MSEPRSTSFAKSANERVRRSTLYGHEHADATHPIRLLRARRERPRRGRAAEQRDELASFQSMELHSIPECKKIRQMDDYSFARFQTNSSVSPDGVLGLVNLSSSAVIEVIIRFCSGPPIKFANVLPSTLAVTVLFASSTEYVP
jgi:hypothetical protein